MKKSITHLFELAVLSMTSLGTPALAQAPQGCVPYAMGEALNGSMNYIVSDEAVEEGSPESTRFSADAAKTLAANSVTSLQTGCGSIANTEGLINSAGVRHNPDPGIIMAGGTAFTTAAPRLGR